MSRLLATLAVLGAVTAGPAQAVVPAGNLLVNPGAEANPGSTDATCGGDIDLSGWDPEVDTFSAIQYGTGAFPSAAVGAKIGGGANLFTGGCPTGTTSTGEQTVDVSVAAAEIDAGDVGATLSGYLGGFENQTDNAKVDAFFLGAGGADLGASGADLTIGPVTPQDRGDVTDLLLRSAVAALPDGTRSIRTLVTLTHFEGSANDGYADNLSLTLGAAPAAPPPVLGRQVNASVVSGTVLVAVRARGGRVGGPGASQKGLRFVPLTDERQIPTGSFLDTSRGTVGLTSATGAGKRTQTGEFTAGIFQVLQSRKRRDKGLTELRLKGGSFGRCRSRGASAAAVSKRTIRSLRSNAKGRFRTRGKHSAATVRGTVWITADRCDGTLTTVKRGRVEVRDFRRKKTVIVRAGKSYLARAKG